MVYANKNTAGKKLCSLFMNWYLHKGKILDIGCGYGFMSYMLHFTSPEREITGIDYDEEKIETANHCFSKTRTLILYMQMY